QALVMSCVWIGHLTSVILYFAVIRNLKKQHSCSVILRECHNCASHGFVSIRRMFAIFATITLILVVFPVAFMAVHEFLICFRWHHEDLSPQELHAHSHNSHAYFRLAIKISTLNPTINVVVYAMKHKQVYIGVREMFSRKFSSLIISLLAMQFCAESNNNRFYVNPSMSVMEIVDWLNRPFFDFFFGLSMVATNTMVFVLIHKHANVRRDKEYSLLAMLVLFNSLLGTMVIYQVFF
ncbi:hypothetical protein PFISCL1PPCAC_25208, partial [Pristionchus fissidentatus]